MQRVDVLIVGAGPVGLFLATELRRRGRACMIVDRANERSTHSKALAIMPGTLEMFESAGIVNRFVAAANRIDGVRFVTQRGSAYVPFGGLKTRYDFVAILPQWRTQALLEGRLAELGTRVLYGHKLVQLRQQAGGAEAVLESPSGSMTVRARYVVGCDGIRSTVREQCGINFEGQTYPGTVLLADARVKTAVPEHEARVHVHASGVLTMFPMSATERRIVVISPREVLPGAANRQRLQMRLDCAGLVDTTVEDVLWSNEFRVHRRLTSAMRTGNVFLAGDSAHTHSPVGGQGMNIGLHDAWNLAGKLSAVLAGEAPESLLDQYERERLPVARGVLRRTDMLTRALVHPHPLFRVTRERIAPRIAGYPIVYKPVLHRLSQLGGMRRLTV